MSFFVQSSRKKGAFVFTPSILHEAIFILLVCLAVVN